MVLYKIGIDSVLYFVFFSQCPTSKFYGVSGGSYAHLRLNCVNTPKYTIFALVSSFLSAFFTQFQEITILKIIVAFKK